MLSRVRPGSGPVSSRSSSISRLISDDLPALGRPITASRSGRSARSPVGSTASELRRRLGGVGCADRAAAPSSRSGMPSPCSPETGSGSPSPSDQASAAALSASRPSHLLATSSTGLSWRRSSSAISWSAGVMPLRASTTNSPTSASARPCIACRRSRPARLSGEPCLEPGRVDDPKLVRAQAADALDPVAGHARRVVDDRLPPADQPIEQGRLADIRAAQDGDGGKGHAITERDQLGPVGQEEDRPVGDRGRHRTPDRRREAVPRISPV